MLTKGLNMKNLINASHIIEIKRESMTIVKGQTNIKICSINQRSVKNKTLSLYHYTISNDFDIVHGLEHLLIRHVSVNCYHRVIKLSMFLGLLVNSAEVLE